MSMQNPVKERIGKLREEIAQISNKTLYPALPTFNLLTLLKKEEDGPSPRKDHPLHSRTSIKLPAGYA